MPQIASRVPRFARRRTGHWWWRVWHGGRAWQDGEPWRRPVSWGWWWRILQVDTISVGAARGRRRPAGQVLGVSVVIRLRQGRVRLAPREEYRLHPIHSRLASHALAEIELVRHDAGLMCEVVTEISWQLIELVPQQVRVRGNHIKRTEYQIVVRESVFIAQLEPFQAARSSSFVEELDIVRRLAVGVYFTDDDFVHVAGGPAADGQSG
mmetsp:Transcript_13952/g.28281  ORF Transcript_13952/g.28281 Transcript_13952/m.28281 type:complete len:209 (+) Transcript_13952:498-1124(+)